jgi:hypothetical protein
MTLETYWLAVPLVGIGLLGLVSIGLWFTRPGKEQQTLGSRKK